MADQAQELRSSEEQLCEIMEKWPYLSERARWDIFIHVWWYVFTSDLARVFVDLRSFFGAAVETLKSK